MAVTYEEALALAAVAAEAECAAYERRGVRFPTDDATTLAALVGPIVDKALAGTGRIKGLDSDPRLGKVVSRWSGADYLRSQFIDRCIDGIWVAFGLRQMDTPTLAMEAFGPESMRTRIATLLLAKRRADDKAAEPDNAEAS